MLILKPDQWQEIRLRLMEEYPPSVMLIRSRMREELGFTVREHQRWVSVKPGEGILTNSNQGYLRLEIHLDFYNDAMQSWFQLKYM